VLLSRNNDDTNPVGVRPRREGKGREGKGREGKGREG
jgi:hypothetical protein